MTTFKPGDRVRFLSTTGSGMVKSVHRNIVNVLIDDGFEIPVEASDLVIIDTNRDKHNPFITKDDRNKTAPPEQPTTPVELPSTKEQPSGILPEKGLYLALVPENQSTLISGDVACYVVNFTTFPVAFHFFEHHNNNGFISVIHALADPGEAVLIDTFSDRDTANGHRFRIQYLFFDTKNAQIFETSVADLDVSARKLMSEDRYNANPFFDEKAFLQTFAQPPVANEKPEQPKAPEKKSPEKNFLIDRFLIDADFAEVDLHIEKLRGDHKTIARNEIMKIQLVFFRQCLDSAIEKGLHRIVFIHGVGAGLLKKELHDILKQYPALEHGDASILKYGIGATEVWIKKL